MAKRPASKAERNTRTKGEKTQRRQPVPWQEIARLLAAGLNDAEVADILGCDLAALRRRVKRWGGSAELVARYRQECAESPEETYRRLVELVYAHLERQVRTGNLRVLLWVADRLRLVRPLAVPRETDELETKLAALAEEDDRSDPEVG